MHGCPSSKAGKSIHKTSYKKWGKKYLQKAMKHQSQRHPNKSLKAIKHRLNPKPWEPKSKFVYFATRNY